MKQHENKGTFSFTAAGKGKTGWVPSSFGNGEQYGKKEVDWLYGIFDLPTEDELAAEAYHCLTSRY